MRNDHTKAGSLKKIANIDWNKDTKMDTLTIVVKKTNQDEILKCNVFAVCKNDKFPDPDAVYLKLPEFC